MCTFCGRDHHSRNSTKTIYVYDRNDKYLGSYEVPRDWSVRRYQERLYLKFPDWDYTKSS